MKEDAKPLKAIINQLIEKYHWDEELNRIRLVEKWEEAVGKIIAEHTTKIWINKRTLYVQLDSSVIRNELSLVNSMIVERLNGYFAKKVIDKMVLM